MTLFLVEATPGVIEQFSVNCRRAGLRFRVLPVQGGPLSARVDEDEDDGRVAPLLIRLERAAEALDCSPTTVKRLIRAGQLASVKVNGATRVRVEDLRHYVETLAAPSTPAEGDQ